jgi:hypothetical protein
VPGNTVSVPAFTTLTGTATCTGGSVLVGGGYSSDNTTAGSFDVYDNYPTSPGPNGTWSVSIGASAAFSFTPYALCAP